MAKQPMETTFRTVLWRQFGAAIDMLENALVACPASLWRVCVFRTPSDHPEQSEDAAFWSITYHTLFWLDLYLTGSHEGFAPPAPFTLNTLGPAVSFQTNPIAKMISTTISCICARSARKRLLSYQKNKRTTRSPSPGSEEIL